MTDMVDIAMTQKRNATVLRSRLRPATLQRRRQRSQVRGQSSHAHRMRTNTHWKYNKHNNGYGLYSGWVFLFLPSALEGAEESRKEGRRAGREGGGKMGGRRGGEDRREGGSMHLWRTAGKGRFSPHPSAPAVCSLVLHALISKHGDSIRSREEGGRWWMGGGGGHHRVCSVHDSVCFKPTIPIFRFT